MTAKIVRRLSDSPRYSQAKMENHRWVSKQGQPFELSRNELQANEIQNRGEIVAQEAQQQRPNQDLAWKLVGCSFASLENDKAESRDVKR